MKDYYNNDLVKLLNFLHHWQSFSEVKQFYQKEGQQVDFAIPQGAFNALEEMGVKGKFVTVYDDENRFGQLLPIYELIFTNLAEKYKDTDTFLKDMRELGEYLKDWA